MRRFRRGFDMDGAGRMDDERQSRHFGTRRMISLNQGMIMKGLLALCEI